MENQALIDGIKQHIDAGHSKDLIHQKVLEAGYTEAEFSAAYSAALAAAETATTTIAPEASTTSAASDREGGTVPRSNKALILIGSLLVVLTVAVGVTYAVTAGLITPPAFLSGLLSSPPYEEGEVLDGMRAGFGQVHSGNYEVSLTIEAAEKDADTYLLPSELQGDGGDPSMLFQFLPKDFKIFGSVSGNFDTGSVSIPKSYSHFSGSYETADFSMHGDVEFILSKENGGYLRVNRMPSLLFVDFSPIKGEWVHLFSELPEELFAELNQETTPETGLSSDEQLALALTLASEHRLFAVAAPVVEEEVNGTTAYKYTLSLRREAIRPFLEELLPELDEAYGERLDETDLDRFTNAAFVEYVNTHYRFLVWARADGIPIRYGLSSRIAIDDDVSSFWGTGRVEGTDAAKKQMLGNLRSQAELHYITNSSQYAGFCNAQENHSSFADRMEEWDISCNDTADAYATMVMLSDASYCVDSAGYAREGSLVAPDATSCGSQVIAPEPEPTQEPEADRQVNFSLFFDLTNINEPIEVEIPETAMPIEEAAQEVPILQYFSTELREEARRNAEDAGTKQQLNSMRFLAELSYDEHSSYAEVCNDLRADAPETDVINEPGTDCEAAATEYVVSAPLHEGNYCIDHTGFAGPGRYDPENGIRCAKLNPLEL